MLGLYWVNLPREISEDGFACDIIDDWVCVQVSGRLGGNRWGRSLYNARLVLCYMYVGAVSFVDDAINVWWGGQR